MGSVNQKLIEETLTECQFYERKAAILREIQGSREIPIGKSQELSLLVRDIIERVVQKEFNRPDISITLAGSVGRGQFTLGSDIDVTLYVPALEENYREIAGIFRQTMEALFHAMGFEGRPMIRIPGDITENKKDRLEVMTTSLCDSIPLQEGSHLPFAQIKNRVQQICEPIGIAIEHEKQLQGFDETILYNSAFDLKKCIRHLQYALWFRAALEQRSVHELYGELETNNTEVFEALHFLLFLRSAFHEWRNGRDIYKADTMHRDFICYLVERFGPDIETKIYQAKLTIRNYVHGCILREKQKNILLDGGIIYGEDGLCIGAEMNAGSIIQLFRIAQKTGIKISDSQLVLLRDATKSNLAGPQWAELLFEEGSLSGTVDELIKLESLQHLIPNSDAIAGKSYNDDKLHHQGITMDGRTVVRLRNLEQVTQKDLADIYGGLPRARKAAIRIALLCHDIPREAKIEGGYQTYFQQFGERFPSLYEATGHTNFLTREHRTLFDFAQHDNYCDPEVVRGVAEKIGDKGNLDMLLVYTFATLDSTRGSLHSPCVWDRVMDLYETVLEHLEGSGPDSSYGKRIQLARMRMMGDDERIKILDRAPVSLLRCRYTRPPLNLEKVMKRLKDVQKSGNPQITLGPVQNDRVFRLSVSASDSTQLPAIIAGACAKYNVSVLGAQIHTIPSANGSDKPLVIAFFEVQFDINDDGAISQNEIKKNINTDMQKGIEEDSFTWGKPPDKILQKAELSNFIIEETAPAGNYKLIIEAKKDVTGFLFAIANMISQSGLRIIGMNVYTQPGTKIRDIFTIQPCKSSGNPIEVLREKLQKYTEALSA